jgi:hypothetical protein
VIGRSAKQRDEENSMSATPLHPLDYPKMSPPLRVTPDDFRERAKYYRFAAALTDAPRDAEMFNELAMMFGEIAAHFRRAEANRKSRERAQPIDAGPYAQGRDNRGKIAMAESD